MEWNKIISFILIFCYYSMIYTEIVWLPLHDRKGLRCQHTYNHTLQEEYGASRDYPVHR